MSLPAPDQLKSLIERIERVEEDIASLNADKSDIYKEARSLGLDPKIMRKVVAKRKLAADDRDEQDAVFEIYWNAVHGLVQVHPRTRENIDKIDAETGEVTVIDADDDDGNHLTVTVDPRIAAILAGSSNGRTPEFDSGNAGSTPAPASSFTSRGHVLRPHCQKPGAEDCGGVGSKHCYSCEKLMRGSEAA